MKTLLLSVFTALILVSIYSCECRINCGDKDYHSTFFTAGFSDTELTPLILRRYVAGSNFTQLKDSLVVTEFSNYEQHQGVIFNTFYESNSPNTEYTLTLLTVGRNFEISNFTFEKEECKRCGKKYIINTLKGYTLNGEVKSTDGFVQITE